MPLIMFSVFAAAIIVWLFFVHRKDIMDSADMVVLEGICVFLGFCLYLVLFIVRVYFRLTRTFEELPDNRITIRFDAEGFTYKTSESVTTCKWSAIRKLLKFPDCLLLFFRKKGGDYLALPVPQLGAELSRAIEDKVRQYGGAVA